MQQQMEAEILFLDPADVNAGVAALTARGFEVEVMDWVDPGGPTVWIMARIATGLSQDAFFEYIHDIAEELNGDVVEAGLQFPGTRH
jgi:hypothetical protein